MHSKVIAVCAAFSLLVGGQALLGGSAAANTQASVSPVRASTFDDVPFASLSWVAGSVRSNTVTIPAR